MTGWDLGSSLLSSPSGVPLPPLQYGVENPVLFLPTSRGTGRSGKSSMVSSLLQLPTWTSAAETSLMSLCTQVNTMVPLGCTAAGRTDR